MPCVIPLSPSRLYSCFSAESVSSPHTQTVAQADGQAEYVHTFHNFSEVSYDLRNLPSHYPPLPHNTQLPSRRLTQLQNPKSLFPRRARAKERARAKVRKSMHPIIVSTRSTIPGLTTNNLFNAQGKELPFTSRSARPIPTVLTCTEIVVRPTAVRHLCVLLICDHVETIGPSLTSLSCLFSHLYHNSTGAFLYW